MKPVKVLTTYNMDTMFFENCTAVNVQVCSVSDDQKNWPVFRDEQIEDSDILLPDSKLSCMSYLWS